MVTPTRLRLPDPSHANDWISVAKARLAEARQLIREDANCVGSAYLAGYAIECTLKAYLTNRGVPRPTSGGEGHNLRALWSACDLALKDLTDPDGSKNYFMTDWSTDLRYQLRKNTSIVDPHLVNGAGRILSRITTLMRRRTRHNR